MNNTQRGRGKIRSLTRAPVSLRAITAAGAVEGKKKKKNEKTAWHEKQAKYSFIGEVAFGHYSERHPLVEHKSGEDNECGVGGVAGK